MFLCNAALLRWNIPIRVWRLDNFALSKSDQINMSDQFWSVAVPFSRYIKSARNFIWKSSRQF